MKVVIETVDAGTSWKLQTLPEGKTLASSVTYFPSMDACLDDLAINATTWKSHLPGRTVETVGEVGIVTNGVDGKTLADLWPDLEESPL